MTPLIKYRIFFLTCMVAIALLTYLPDRGAKRTEAREKPSEPMEQGFEPLHQIEIYIEQGFPLRSREADSATQIYIGIRAVS